MEARRLYPRFAKERLTEALADTPVVLIHGPRQSGKTTLAQSVGSSLGYDYFSFDDEGTLAAARTDPVGFVGDLPERVILDEVQRVPELFTTFKASVDRNRKPGRFLLTGSANVLLLPKLADSLAGRMEILRLYPLAQGEIEENRTNLLERLFGASFEMRNSERLSSQLTERIVNGGYPAALARAKAHRRATWYRDYCDTIVQRDIRDLAKISRLETLPRLLMVAAGQTSRLLNFSDLASPFQVTRQTIRDYVTLLERVFLVEILPPWHSNQLSRLVKTPKLHIGDTGIACALLGLDAATLAQDRAVLGQQLESFVFQELRKQASWSELETRFFHFRDRDGVEVDLVLERGALGVVGVEIKASATIRQSDFRGLRKLRSACAGRFAGGYVFYDGEVSIGFGEGMYAVPIRALWEPA